MRQATLCLLIKDNEILLALKKRGFGAGRWNGAGGKFDFEKGDKTILDTAVRETIEEIGVEIINPKKAGVFHFTFPHKPEWDQDVHLFLANEWIGNPLESEEMSPKWFKFGEIPYDKMWPDDKFWLPHILKGWKVEADFVFEPGDKIKEHKINIFSSWV